MSKNKIAKLRAKLRAAEERGFNTALDMMHQFVDSVKEQPIDYPQGSTIKSVVLETTYNKVLNKIADLRTSI